MPTFSLVESRWGAKIRIVFPYDPQLVEFMKSLPWDTTHARREKEDGIWVWYIDATPEAIAEFEKCGIQVPDEIKSQVLNTIYIILKGNRGYLKGQIPDSLDKALYQRLAFQPLNYEYTDAYKEGTWDGWVRLYSVESKSFPIGLLNFVEDEIRKAGFSCKIVDRREIGYHTSWEYVGPPLRDYQQEVVDKVIQRGGIGTIMLPTAAGKTIVGLALMAHYKVPTLVLVHRKDLLYQWRDEILKNLSNVSEVALFGDGIYNEGEITVAMIQSVYERGLQKKYDLLLADECHHIPADTFVDVCRRVDAKYRIGLSATPWREDERDMLIWSEVGQLIVPEKGVEGLVRDGVLARPHFVVIEGARVFGFSWDDEYERAIFDKGRTNRIVNLVRQLFQQGYRIYVDVIRIEHGRMIEEALKSSGVPAEFISGVDASQTRRDVLKRFEEQGDFVLVSTLIKEGVNLPQMNAVVLAGGGKSRIRTIQTIGRALRPKPGSNYALIVDVHDYGRYVERHFLERQRAMALYYGPLYDGPYKEGGR
jgi:superfamily II DNA or RNA helicase